MLDRGVYHLRQVAAPCRGALGQLDQFRAECRPRGKESRQEIAAHSIAQVRARTICGILDPPNRALLGVGVQLGPRDVQEWPAHRRRRSQPSEATCASAAKGSHEYGLALVVAVVRRENRSLLAL